MPLGLETCVTAGKALGALFAFASNLDEKRRKNVAEYLEAIADALDGIASAAEGEQARRPAAGEREAAIEREEPRAVVRDREGSQQL